MSSLQGTFTVGSDTRPYLQHKPLNFNPAKGLIVALHPAGALTLGSDGLMHDFSLTQVQSFTDFSNMADVAGFAVIYPHSFVAPGATSWHWSALRYCPKETPTPRVDSDYLAALIVAKQKELNVAPSRTFICGFSSGAQMAQRMAIEWPALLKAVGSVCGCAVVWDADAYPAIPIERPASLPAILFRGGSDTLYMPPYNKIISVGTTERVENGGADGDHVFWQDASFPAMYSGTTLVHDNRIQADVRSYIIQNSGHNWPRRSVDLTQPFTVTGAPHPYNSAVAADPVAGKTVSDLMWNFFDSRP